MCNLYSTMRMRAENASLARTMSDRNNNQPPMAGVYPDYPAPIVIQKSDGAREMLDARWGMPTPQKFLAGKNADRGVTNVRNPDSPHWKRWLGPASRCLVPFTSFAEPNQANPSENVWFALSEERPAAFFAGIWTPWTCVRKVKEGEITCDVYAFLTTNSNDEVGAVHKKAMPVILTNEAEWGLWLSHRPWAEVKALQRPLPDGSLTIVQRGVGMKNDPFVPAY